MTDARYFASRFVDMMALSWKENQQYDELWNAVKAWIDGVEWSLQVEQASLVLSTFMKTNNIKHCLVRDKPMAELPSEIHQWILVESQRGLSQISTSWRHPSVRSIILTHSLYWSHAQHLAKSSIPIWLEIDGPQEVTKIKNEQIKLEGIVLTGSPEEETGIKSYEAMDDIFDEINLNWPENS